MVADVVDHLKHLALDAAKTAAKLLQPDDRAFGGGAASARCRSRARRTPSIEHVDREQDIDLALPSAARELARGAEPGPE